MNINQRIHWLSDWHSVPIRSQRSCSVPAPSYTYCIFMIFFAFPQKIMRVFARFYLERWATLMVLPRFFSIRRLPGRKQRQTCDETRKRTDMSICVGDTEHKWAFTPHHFLSFLSHSFKTLPSMLATRYFAPWWFCSSPSPCRINASPICPPQSLPALVFLLLLSNCHFARPTSPATAMCVCVCVCFRSSFSMFKHPFASHY